MVCANLRHNFLTWKKYLIKKKDVSNQIIINFFHFTILESNWSGPIKFNWFIDLSKMRYWWWVYESFLSLILVFQKIHNYLSFIFFEVFLWFLWFIVFVLIIVISLCHAWSPLIWLFWESHSSLCTTWFSCIWIVQGQGYPLNIMNFITFCDYWIWIGSVIHCSSYCISKYSCLYCIYSDIISICCFLSLN